MDNQKIPTLIGTAVIVIIAATIGLYAYQIEKNNWQEMPDVPSVERPNDKKPLKKECTQEAKVCPDGKTSVGRTGPNCEFAPCPGEDGIVGNDKDEHGCIGSAGYSWCEEKQKCLREWEESCGKVDTPR